MWGEGGGFVGVSEHLSVGGLDQLLAQAKKARRAASRLTLPPMPLQSPSEAACMCFPS